MYELLQSLKSKLKSVVVWVVGLMIPLTFAAAVQLQSTPSNLSPQDGSVLRAKITDTATTMTIEPVIKYVNGVRTTGCFNTGSGFLLVEDFGGQNEYISFNGNSCSSSNITTLSNLRRGLNPTSTTGSLAGGVGLSFDAGASVRVVDFTTIYTNSVYIDVRNYMTGSGLVLCTDTVFNCIQFPSVTTTQRDAMKQVQNGQIVYNTTTSTLDQRTGNAWSSIAAGSTPNASTTVTGKVELGTINEHINATSSGTEANLVVATVNLTGGLITDGAYGLIPILGTGGNLAVGLGGTGSGNMATGGLLITQGSGAMKVLTATEAGSGGSIISNGAGWTTTSRDISVVTATTASSSTITALTATDFDQNYTIPANPAVGDMYDIWIAGNFTAETGDEIRLNFQLNDAEAGDAPRHICRWDGLAASNVHAQFIIHGRLIVQAIGASGRIVIAASCVYGEADDGASEIDMDEGEVGIGEWAIDTTADLLLELTAITNSSASPPYEATLMQFAVTRMNQ